MSLIKPKAKGKKESLKVTIDSQILTEVQQYCNYVGFENIDDFVEEAARHILIKDKDFKAWKDKQGITG